MLCVTGVYLRDITKTVFLILHLNMSLVSISLLTLCHVFAR